MKKHISLPFFLFFALIFLTVFYFWEPLFLPILFSERDLPVFFFPYIKMWVEALKGGEFPLWNPFSFSGQPLFASLQTAILYPVNLLFLIFPMDFAFNLTIILHFLLAGWFIYLFAREIGGSRMAGVIAAVSFSFGGFLLSVHNVLSTLQSVIWVPLVLFLFLRSLRKKSWGYGFLTAFSILIQFLGGGVEIFLLTQVAVVCLGLFPKMIVTEKEIAPLKWRLQAIGVIYLLAFGLGAVQIFPFLEMSHYSIRQKGFSFKDATAWSLAWRELIYIFLPDFFWRGFKFYYVDQNWLKSIYLGIIPLILSMYYFWGNDRRRPWLGLFLLVPLFLALGKNTPFYKFLYDYVPGLNKIRYPVKFYFMTNFFLCLLTGLGWDALVRRFDAQPNKKLVHLKRISLIFAFLSVVFLLGLSFQKDFFLSFFKQLITLGYDRPWALNLHNLIRITFFTLLSFLFFTFLADGKFSPRWAQAGVILLLTSDLFLGNWGQYNYVNRKIFYKPGPNIELIKSDPTLSRIYTNPRIFQSAISAINGEDKTLIGYQERLELDYPAIHGVYNAFGFPLLVYRPYYDLLSLLDTSPNPQTTSLLSVMNVKYLLWYEPLNNPDLKFIRKGYPILIPLPETSPLPDHPPPFKPGNLMLYENEKVLPRAYLTPDFRVIHSEKEMREQIAAKEFNPARTVLLEELPQFPLSENQKGSEKDTVQFLKGGLNHVHLITFCRDRRILFLSETFYPGWKVWVDGKRGKIYRANHAFRALPLGPGRHSITFKYQPFSFYSGLLVSFLTLMSLMACLILSKKKHK